MLLHPEAQQKAQEEIDRVVGRDRLPDLNDRDSIPYLQCVINETSRCVRASPQMHTLNAYCTVCPQMASSGTIRFTSPEHG